MKWLGRFRVFRYEIRRWREGAIPDLVYAAVGPVTIARDDRTAAASAPSSSALSEQAATRSATAIATTAARRAGPWLRTTAADDIGDLPRVRVAGRDRPRRRVGRRSLESAPAGDRSSLALIPDP
jgi:hypothetical protein